MDSSEDLNELIITANVETKSLSTDSHDLNLKRSNFSSDKAETSFIRKVEQIIRSSPEYKEWVAFIKYTLGFYECPLSGEKDTECGCSAHHHPVDLFTIVSSVLSTYMMSNKEFTSLEIAQEVLDLHYENHVGYIVLVDSLHEKFHSGYLDIPIDKVQGNYKYILNNYILSDEQKDTILKYESIKETNQNQWQKNYASTLMEKVV